MATTTQAGKARQVMFDPLDELFVFESTQEAYDRQEAELASLDLKLSVVRQSLVLWDDGEEARMDED
jgi:hypothetical protein